MILSSCERLLQSKKGSSKRSENVTESRRVHVMPYIHRVSHNVKKVANRYGVKTVFSAPCKLARVCSMMHKGLRVPCSKRHVDPAVECVTGVVYEIPLSCGRCYIGQTGRCFNERAREHSLAVRSHTGGHLDLHCRRCGCSPNLKETRILYKSNDKMERELIEAFFIARSDNCVSMPSLTLLPKEQQF